MSDWLPCLYAAILIGAAAVISAGLGYAAGRLREQLALLEMLRPEHSHPVPKWI